MDNFSYMKIALPQDNEGRQANKQKEEEDRKALQTSVLLCDPSYHSYKEAKKASAKKASQFIQSDRITSFNNVGYEREDDSPRPQGGLGEIESALRLTRMLFTASRVRC